MDEATGRTDRPGTTDGRSRPRVVVGVDGSAGSRQALTWALAAAGRRGGVLEVVSAFPVDLWWADAHLADRTRVDALRADAEARTHALVEEARRDTVGTPAVPVEVVVVPGAPAEHLVQVAQGADLLVVGSRGRGAVRSTLLGSVALHCSIHASCPVVVVHPQQTPGPSRVARRVPHRRRRLRAFLTLADDQRPHRLDDLGAAGGHRSSVATAAARPALSATRPAAAEIRRIPSISAGCARSRGWASWSDVRVSAPARRPGHGSQQAHGERPVGHQTRTGESSA